MPVRRAVLLLVQRGLRLLSLSKLLRALLLGLPQVQLQAQVVLQLRAGGLVPLQVRLRAVLRVVQRVQVLQWAQVQVRAQVLLRVQGLVEGQLVLQVRPRAG